MKMQGPVLVVDDYKVMREIMVSMIQRLNFGRVEEAETAEEALSHLRAERFGLVVCDVHMQPIGGIELIQAMRLEPNLAAIPVLMVSADERAVTKEAVLRLGSIAFLRKPFDMRQLADALESVDRSVAG